MLNPELAQLLPVLYPGVFPNLEAYNKGTPKRDDLVAIFLTGIPTGVVPGFQNSMGTVQADMLRLNLAIPPTTRVPNNLGLLGDDPAGFPNGRRVFDDVVTIELRAVAGATLPLVDKSFTPDAAASQISDGLTADVTDMTAMGTENYLPELPVPRHAAQRLRRSGRELMTHHHEHVEAVARTERTGERARPTSAATSARRCCTCPRTLAGLEIEIRPVGEPWDGTHTAVRERHLGDVGDLGRVLRVARRRALRSPGQGRQARERRARVDGRSRRRSDVVGMLR